MYHVAPPGAEISGEMGVDEDAATGFDDPLVWTPSAITAEFNRIRTVLDAVNLEVSNAAKAGVNKISGDEWQNWRQQYLAGHKFVSTASNLWGSNIAPARRYEKEALKWRDLVKSRGGRIVGPASQGRTEQETEGKPTSTAVKAGIFIALGIAGAIAAAELIKSVKH